jgi:hypothetical protein
MKSIVLASLAISGASGVSPQKKRLDEEGFDRINAFVNRIEADREKFADELRRSEFAAISPQFKPTSKRSRRSVQGQTLPLVFLHGMGDSCFNNGMESITKESGDYLGVYSVCIPTGDTRIEDTINGE